MFATRNKCIATSNKGLTSNKKLFANVETRSYYGGLGYPSHPIQAGNPRGRSSRWEITLSSERRRFHQFDRTNPWFLTLCLRSTGNRSGTWNFCKKTRKRRASVFSEVMEPKFRPSPFKTRACGPRLDNFFYITRTNLAFFHLWVRKRRAKPGFWQ